MRLSEVRHQRRAIAVIRRSLSSGRTPHAYLFTGPEGVGKESAARALAGRLLCEAAEAIDACGACRSCRLLAAGNHLDFHLIHRGLHKLHPDPGIRAEAGLFMAVEVIRHFLIAPAGNMPSLGRRRVFVIRQAERMNAAAQNALLKTLEEPPGQACLILLTSSAERLLPTVRSRCQQVAFDLLPPAFVEQRLLAEAGVSGRQARTLARLAQGRIGPALRWHQIGLLRVLDELNGLLADRAEQDPPRFAAAVVAMASGLATGLLAQAAAGAARQPAPARSGRAPGKTIPTDELREALKLVLMLIAAVYRDALLVRAGQSAQLAQLPAGLAAVRRLAGELSLPELERRIPAVAAAERLLDRNVAPQLACEHMAVALAGELAVAG